MSLPKPDATTCEETIAKVLHSVPAFILMVDADGLKGINDRYGHTTGTAYLTEIWDRLHRAFPYTLWHRYGGDEFYGVIAALKVNEADLLTQAKSVTGMASIHGRDILIACSIGLYSAEKGESGIAAMAMADQAMYQVKKNHHGGLKVFSTKHCLALLGEWPEAWITVPISEGWRVLVYSDTTSPAVIPTVDLIVAKKPIPNLKAKVWTPENDDIGKLIEKLHDFSVDMPLEAPNQAESDLVWEEPTKGAVEEPTAGKTEISTQDLLPTTKLYTDWDETPKEKEPLVTDPYDESQGSEFIPWRAVKPTVWEKENLEEVPIIMDDPLVSLKTEEKTPIILKPKVKTKKVKPRRERNAQNLLKISAQNLKLKVSSVLSSVEIPHIEIPHIEMPRITLKELSISEIIPKNLTLGFKDEKNQAQVQASDTQNPLPDALTEPLLGKILWFWAETPGIGVSHLTNHTAQVLSERLPVLLLDGNLQRPSLSEKYPCEGPGWETSWLRKMPGKHPAHFITAGNLRVWVLKQSVGPFKDTEKMWEVALFHLKTPEETIVIDGGGQEPPSGVDFKIQMLSNEASPEQAQTEKTILVSRQRLIGTILYDGSRTGIHSILKQCQELM